MTPGETRLRDALCRLKRHCSLAASVEDMFARIHTTAEAFRPQLHDSTLWTEAWAEADTLIRPLAKEAASALRDHVAITSAARARKVAKNIFSDREHPIGAPIKVHPSIVNLLCDIVEEIAGCKLSYRRERTSKTKPTISGTVGMSGPPKGEMLDVLLAAIDWAYFLARPYSEPVFAANAEAVLTIIKKARRSPNTPT